MSYHWLIIVHLQREVPSEMEFLARPACLHYILRIEQFAMFLNSLISRCGPTNPGKCNNCIKTCLPKNENSPNYKMHHNYTELRRGPIRLLHQNYHSFILLLRHNTHSSSISCTCTYTCLHTLRYTCEYMLVLFACI